MKIPNRSYALIAVMYAAPCLECKYLIHEGQTAKWIPGKGIAHPDCAKRSDLFVLSPIFTIYVSTVINIRFIDIIALNRFGDL